ncbi:MAG: type II toxin-antitoxin system RelE/ParE family toxin [Acidobacteria bacterium]|nr:type II toxin-antitoxin system RelE/ParE family toxin [Acidobacteriota bacterium]
MEWRVETLNAAVDAELEGLPVDMRAKFVHIAELLQTFGPFEVREPYVKPLGNKLFEMRMKGRDGIARAIYVPASGRRLVVLHAFVKKTAKTPRSAIRLALDRAKGVL